jgi:psiF repeat-containing protein
MHKNPTMLAASFVALTLAFGSFAHATEEGGGAEVTQADMPKVCNEQAENRQLTGAERSTYLKKCTESTPQSVERSARKMEGQK